MPTQIVTIPAGQCVILPTSAVITSISVQEGAIVDSTCPSIPTPVATQCYVVTWMTDIDEGGAVDPWDDVNVSYVGFYIGTTYYPFTAPVGGGDEPNVAIAVTDVLPGAFISASSCAAGTSRHLYFETISTIGDNFFLAFSVNGYNEVLVRAIVDEDCDSC